MLDMLKNEHFKKCKKQVSFINLSVIKMLQVLGGDEISRFQIDIYLMLEFPKKKKKKAQK